MALSQYYEDEDVIAQLRDFFEDDNVWSIDFKAMFNQIEDDGECFKLRIKNRVFKIDYITGAVTEVD